jgi:hypothetical protein
VWFSGNSTYTSADQLYLDIFVLEPGAGGCPAQAVMPPGADPVLIDEPVDNFLTITDLSDNLNSPGQWSLCGYLSDASAATVASSSVSFMVSGPSVHEESEEESSGAGKDTPALVLALAHHTKRYGHRSASKHHRHRMH